MAQHQEPSMKTSWGPVVVELSTGPQRLLAQNSECVPCMRLVIDIKTDHPWWPRARAIIITTHLLSFSFFQLLLYIRLVPHGSTSTPNDCLEY